jgi:pyrroloquinoline quinone (PQQ) biosynthesis protein C
MTATLSPRDQVAALAAEALLHRAVRHPYLRGLAEGSFDTRFALADFARHYHGYSAHFSRYLMTLIDRLENPDHRQALLENLSEESGRYPQEELSILEGIGIERSWIEGIPHSKLFERFCRAVGVHVGAEAGPHEEALEVVCWRELLLATLQTASPAEAVGVLGLGTENIVRSIYQPICQAIARVPELSPRDTVFFPLHTAVDDHHQETLQEIAADLASTPQGVRDLAKGMRKALALRCSFWDWLEERARARTAPASPRFVMDLARNAA